jgi:hypothetical protein
VEIKKDAKNPSGLSEFFSALSKEKDDVRQKIKEKIDDPKSGLSGLFNQLEEALQETKKVSVEEDTDNTRLSSDDQNKLDVFSNLLNALGSDKEIPAFVEELEPEELIPEELVVESEEPQNDIITSVIRNLDVMSKKTHVKEEVEQISSIRKEFDSFRSFIAQQIGSLQMSGAGSGETRLEFLDDVDRATAKVDGKALVYNSSDGKWKGESILTAAITGLDIDGATDIGAAIADADLFIIDDGAGGTNRKVTASRIKTYIDAADASAAADDITAGDAAILLTTSSGNITIDAAANDSDIILKGTDGGADTTFLTIDGSAAGAATFNSTVTATGFVGDVTGNADTATAIATARTIGMTGDVVWTSASFDGSGNVTGSATIQANSVDGTMIALGSDASGDVMYYNGTNYVRLGKGDDAQVLTLASGVPSWAAASGGGSTDEAIQDVVGAMFGSNTETGITVTYQDADGTIDLVVGTLNQNTTGSAATLTTARTIGGTSFDGSANIAVGLATLATTVTITDNESTNESNALIFTAGGDIDGGNLGLESDGTLTYNPSTGKVTATGFVGTLAGAVTGDVTGNADTATVLATARTIGGVSFNGSANINLPGVNSAGNQNTSGSAATLTTARTIGGTSFDGSTNIAVGLATLATTVTITDNESTNESNALIFTAGGDVDGGNLGLESDGTLTYNPSTGKVTATGFVGTLTGAVTGDVTGNADTATTLATARTIGGTSFDGSANIAVALATLATTATVSDSTANTNFPVVFNNESNALLDDTGALRYNPSTGTLLVPNLVVAGTTTQVDTVTMNAANAVVFEGATADIHETTLTVIDPTADRTQRLINQSGYIPLLAALTTTAITSTPEELNILDGATVVVGEINALDLGSTAVGTAIASKAVILDSNKDYTGIRNLTITGEIDAATGDFSGVVDIAGATTTAAITASGIIKTDDSTAATSTTDGSLQTDGGLSVVLDAVIGDDIIMISDAAQIAFGVNSEITLAHVHNVGLTIEHHTAGDNLPIVLQLKSEEDIIVANEVIASIEFAAGDSDGTDGATVAAGIHAIAEDTFSASANATKLVFTTGVSETAASSATAKMTLSSAGLLTIADDFIIKDGGTIGSASDVDAMAIASNGVVTFSQIPVMPANSIDSDEYIDGSIDRAHLAADIIDGTKIADDAINSEHYAADSIDEEHIANDAVGSAELKSLSTLLIKNAAGSTLKTLYGAGA